MSLTQSEMNERLRDYGGRIESLAKSLGLN